MAPLHSCGPQSGASAAPPLVGPEQECNFNFITNVWSRLAIRCGCAQPLLLGLPKQHLILLGSCEFRVSLATLELGCETPATVKH